MAQRGSSPPILPDVSKTPGDTLDVTRADICVAGYTKTVRNVPTAVKDAVYGSYGIGQHAPGEYEMDHLIRAKPPEAVTEGNLAAQKSQIWLYPDDVSENIPSLTRHE